MREGVLPISVANVYSSDPLCIKPLSEDSIWRWNRSKQIKTHCNTKNRTPSMLAGIKESMGGEPEKKSSMFSMGSDTSDKKSVFSMGGESSKKSIFGSTGDRFKAAGNKIAAGEMPTLQEESAFAMCCPNLTMRQVQAWL